MRMVPKIYLQDGKIRIYDVLGNEVLSEKLNAEKQVNVIGLPQVFIF